MCRMATQSFLKAVTLRGEKEAKSFIRAVERSREHDVQRTIHYERTKANDMDKETIRSIFCKDAEGSK